MTTRPVRPRRTAPAGPARRRWCKARGADRPQVLSTSTLALAPTVLALTAPKVGSDSNYQIESTILLILCACVALHSLNFFELLFRRSKSWITLLQIPLIIHLVLNYRIAALGLVEGIPREQKFRAQVAAVAPYLADGGRVISTDVNTLVRLRSRIEVEPLIYTLLVKAGHSNPEPVRRDIAAHAFSTIILFEDLNQRAPEMDTEVPSLPAAQIEEVRKHYRLVDHIPGPYQAGIYVYKPAGQTLP